MTDLVNIYMPDYDEVPASSFLSMRARLVTWFKAYDAELDTTPNSVFGDLVLTPLAYNLAAQEIALDRFMSDLDLEQVAKGTIYNCDFVRKFLKNFAVVDQTTLQSSGIIRVVFSADDTYTIDRRTRYQFNDEDGTTFDLRLPHPGHLVVLPVGSTVEPYQNQKVLTQIGEGEYAVDLGLVGTMESPVLKGATGTTDLLLSDIIGLYATVDFDYGLPPDSLPTLAERSRTTFYGATMSTRQGAKHYLTKQFPDLTAVSPVVTGDVEQVRDGLNPLGVSSGKLDVFVKSVGFVAGDEHSVRLTYDADLEKFVGELDLMNHPYYIDSIVYSEDDTIDLGLRAGGIKIYSKSLNAAKAPMLQAAYSVYEQLFISIDMPKSDLNVPLIAPKIGSDGSQYSDFVVTFRSDPMVPVVHDAVSSRDIGPIGVDVLTKGFVLVVVSDLLIEYTRKPGVTVTLDTARHEIYDYFRTLGYDTLYSDSRIVDTMYYAGASDVRSISCDAKVQWTLADVVLKEDAPSVLTDLAGAEAAGLTPPTLTIASSGSLVPHYVDPFMGTDAATYAAVGPRNVAYLLDKANIRFSEVSV